MHSSFLCFFFFNDPATNEIYTVSDTLSLHDALPSFRAAGARIRGNLRWRIRRGHVRGHDHRRSEEHTSELQSPDTCSYAVFCLKKKPNNTLKSRIHSQILTKKRRINFRQF